MTYLPKGVPTKYRHKHFFAEYEVGSLEGHISNILSIFSTLTKTAYDSFGDDYKLRDLFYFLDGEIYLHVERDHEFGEDFSYNRFIVYGYRMDNAKETAARLKAADKAKKETKEAKLRLREKELKELARLTKKYNKE